MEQKGQDEASTSQREWKAPQFKESLSMKPSLKAEIAELTARQSRADSQRANEIRESIGIPAQPSVIEPEPQKPVSSVDRFAAEISPILEITDNHQFEIQAGQLIAGRLEELKASEMQAEAIDPGTIEINHDQLNLDGFIGPDTAVKRNIAVDGFHMEDTGAYQGFAKTLQELKAQVGDQPIRSQLPRAVFRQVIKYFGNSLGGDAVEVANVDFYGSEQDRRGTDPEHRTSIKDFQGKGIATCAEKAALAQNLFLIAGYKSSFVFGGVSKSGEKSLAHAYNILETEKGKFLVDVTNPTVYTKDGKIVNLEPSIYPISEEQLSGLSNGQPIEVTHTDYEQGEDDTDSPKQTQLSYS